jgi:hypothetical protein
MERFKEMLAEILRMSVEIDNRTDVPYILMCEAKYLKATVEDMHRRMEKDCSGYRR